MSTTALEFSLIAVVISVWSLPLVRRADKRHDRAEQRESRREQREVEDAQAQQARLGRRTGASASEGSTAG